MADPVNPYAPSGLDRLSMLLMSLGSGISGAEASGRSGWAGLGPAAAMYGGAMANANQNAAAWDQWNQQRQSQEAYRKLQEEDIRSRVDERKRAAGLEERLMGMVPGLMQPPGMGMTPPAPTIGPGGDYFSVTGTAETGGSANPYRQPNLKGSGAYGKYQFTPDTWASVATQNPQLGLPFNMRQSTDEQQEAAMRALTESNARALSAAGITPTKGNLYLAHRFGAEGAKTVMRAPPGTPISSLFPPIWTEQNPDMRGATVDQFRQRADSRFGGSPQMPGPPPDGSRYAPLALSPRLAPVGTILQNRDKAQYDYGWKTYEEGNKRREEQRDQGNKDRDYNFQVRKYEGEGQFVRGADGVERFVPQSDLRGTTRTDKPPEPGTVTGDIAVINKALKDPVFASTPEYAASYNRAKGHLIDGPSGLKYAPDMSTYPAPTFQPSGAPAQPSGSGPVGLTPVGERTYTETQNKDHTYAARLANAIPQLEALARGDDGKYSTAKLPSAYERAKGDSAYVPDSFVSQETKQFRQIVKDILTATLRRESGASIAPSEFTSEYAKFIPQAGDDEKTIRQKLTALKIAARTIAEGSGRPLKTYGSVFDAAPEAPPGPVRIDMRGNRK